MPLTRTLPRRPSPDAAVDLAPRWFRALGDRTRLRLLGLLGQGEQCVCHLTDALETGQSRLSFHLKALKEAGIVTDRREGRWVYYALNPAAIAEVPRNCLRFIAIRTPFSPRRTARGRGAFPSPNASRDAPRPGA